MPASGSESSPAPASDSPAETTTTSGHKLYHPIAPPPVGPDVVEGAPPPPSVIPFIKSALRASAFLQGLKDEELHVSGKDLTDLASRAKCVRFQPGQTLLQQGIKGTTPAKQPLYVIQSGESAAYIAKKHAHAGQPMRVGSVKQGEIVGDMQLYTDVPPSVSVKSEGEVVAWEIDRATFDAWIASRPAVKHSLEQRTWLWSALARNYLFRNLDDDFTKETLLSRFEPMHAGYDQPIVQLGEHGDRFYVVQQGICAVEVPQITGIAKDDNATVPSGAGSTVVSKPSEPSKDAAVATPAKAKRKKELAHETDEEDIPASSRTGHAGKLVHPPGAWAGVNTDLPEMSFPMVRVAEKKPSESFGEIALLYNVPRCATVRCVSKEGCGLWSVDAQSFLSAASKGSLYLKHIFFEYASVKDPSGERLMNQKDFFEAIKHTKWGIKHGFANPPKRGQALSTDPNQLNESTLKLMFHLADQSGDDLISFSEFVLLYSLLQAPFTKYQMAFRMFDRDRNGFIDRSEFIQVIKSLVGSSEKDKYTNLSKDPFIIELFGPDEEDQKKKGKKSTKPPKQLTYAEFESLLSRDVLPSFLQGVSNDLKAINSYWQQVDLALSQSSSFSDGMMSGSALSAANAAPKSGAATASSISWKSLVAGGVAGAVSRTLVSPLERLKLLFQMQGNPPKYTGILQGLRLIHAEDGIKGYFRGNLSNVIRITPASAFQFFFYDCYKRLFYGERKDLNPIERLGAGGMAGMTACLLTYPLDFIRARLTLQGGQNVAYRGITHGITTVVRQQGVRGLYAGLWPSLVGVFPYIGIDFAVYETLRTHLPPSMKNANGDTSRIALFCCGATAGVVGQTVAYPLDLVRRRLQVQGFSGTKFKYEGGILRTMAQIVREEGIRGLYRGTIANYAKVVPAVSVSFVIYEQMRKVLDMTPSH